jgi:hypothetical protein
MTHTSQRYHSQGPGYPGLWQLYDETTGVQLARPVDTQYLSTPPRIPPANCKPTSTASLTVNALTFTRLNKSRI